MNKIECEKVEPVDCDNPVTMPEAAELTLLITEKTENSDKKEEPEREEDYDDYEMIFPDEYHSDEMMAKLTIAQENRSNDGKLQRVYSNGKKEVVFANGVKREVWPDGY